MKSLKIVTPTKVTLILKFSYTMINSLQGMFIKVSLQILIVAEIIFQGLLFAQQKIIFRAEKSLESSAYLQTIHHSQKPRIALVLSGGGARGIAHLGVLKALEEAGIHIDLIVGTSMGSVIGGLYASGYSTKEMQTIIDTTRWAYVLSLTDDTEREDMYLSQKVIADKKQLTIRFNGLTPILPSSLSSGQRLTNFINQLALQSIYHPINTFDDLKIPFRSVSTDLVSGKKIVFSKGSLSEALRSSISVPLLYTPIKKDSLELTDGGLVSNIPVDVALDLHADIIIAVDVSSPLRTAAQLTNAWEVADQIINIMADPVKKFLLSKATIVVKPDIGGYSATDFSQLGFLVQQGYYGMKKKIPALKDSLQSFFTLHFPQGNFKDSTLTVDSVIVKDSSTHYFFDSSISNYFHKGSISFSAIQQKILGLNNTGWFQYVDAEITRVDSITSLTITVDHNPKIHSIILSGVQSFDSTELLHFYDTLVGKPFNNENLTTANEHLLKRYRENGMSLARVLSSFDSIKGALAINVNEGIIHSIRFEGSKTTRDWVIRRELPFQSGDIFTADKAKQGLANLYATNLFGQVLIDIGYEGDDPIVIVHLNEKKSDLTRIGMRIDNERNIQPSLEVRNDNLFGTATEAGVTFAGGARNRKLIFDIKANRIFNTYYTANINLFHTFNDIYTYGNNPNLDSKKNFERIRIGEYRQIFYGGSLSLGRQVERFGTVSVEYRLESNAIHFLDGIGYTPEEYSLQALKLSSLIDTQDRFPFARNGSITHLSWETATSSLKSIIGNIGYSKIFLSYEWFNSVAAYTVHPKIQIGFADKTLPLAQEFSWGGEDSFFGLFENDSRGRQIFLTSLEVRSLLPFKIIWDTYIRARYDFGNIWQQQENISIRDFHHGIGIGVAIDTPLGPASFSLGKSFYIRRDILEQPLTLGPLVTYISFGYPIQ